MLAWARARRPPEAQPPSMSRDSGGMVRSTEAAAVYAFSAFFCLFFSVCFFFRSRGIFSRRVREP